MIDHELEAAILRAVQADTDHVIAGSVCSLIVQADPADMHASDRMRLSWQEYRDGAVFLAGAWTTVGRIARVIDRHTRKAQG